MFTPLEQSKLQLTPPIIFLFGGAYAIRPQSTDIYS